jgi:carboxymethylenebutenolidase
MGKMIDLGESNKLSAYLAEPEIAPKGAIIVIHEVWGLNDHTKSVADRLASEGYIALAPSLIDFDELKDVDTDQLQKDLFNPETRNEVQPKLREIMAPMHAPDFAVNTMASLQEHFDYLNGLDGLSGKVAVMGFCFGGSYSYSLAISEPNLKIALAFYGHCDQSIDDLKKIKCPVRAYIGDQDERLITALPDLTKRMEAAEVDFQSIIYKDAGHAFFNDSNPYAYNEAAAKDSWVQVKMELAKVFS